MYKYSEKYLHVYIYINIISIIYKSIYYINILFFLNIYIYITAYAVIIYAYKMHILLFYILLLYIMHILCI